ncbi:MAG: hypothetical protein K9M96_01080 [Deltaproteobacteria bacterium]|nr:hypothetical protein [Deltaproteobacteria bacterium]
MIKGWGVCVLVWVSVGWFGAECGLVVAGTVSLPETGQTHCWDAEGRVIPCPGTGQRGVPAMKHQKPC